MNAASTPLPSEKAEVPDIDATDEPQPQPKPRHPIDASLHQFLNGVYGIQQSVQVVIPHVASWVRDEIKKLDIKYKGYLKDAGKGGSFVFKTGSGREVADLLALQRTVGDLRAVNHTSVIAQSLFTQVFCEFDAFIGALLKAIYTSKPELFEAIDKKMSIAEMRVFGSIDAAMMAMIEDEIDVFRRNSYVEQFSALENRFGLMLKKFPEWGEFVELGQRRNLLIHNGGVVNDQYRSMCGREGHEPGRKTSLGTKLDVDVPYLSRALLVMRKVAFMLTHTLWRKVLPAQMEDAHLAGDEILYDMLQKKMWLTAIQVGEFFLTPLNCKNLKDSNRRARVINTAIAYKFSGQQDQCTRMLDAEDWSSSFRDFRLAYAVLKDDLDHAWLLMKQIGPTGEMINEVAYRDWPLFNELRSKVEFHDIFQEIYGESFLEQVESSSDGVAADLGQPHEVLDSGPEPKHRKSAKLVTNRSSTMNPASIPGKKTAAPKKTATPKAKASTTKKTS